VGRWVGDTLCTRWLGRPPLFFLLQAHSEGKQVVGLKALYVVLHPSPNSPCAALVWCVSVNGGLTCVEGCVRVCVCAHVNVDVVWAAYLTVIPVSNTSEGWIVTQANLGPFKRCL